MQFKLEKLETLEQVREFTEATAAGLERMEKASAYELVTATRARFSYWKAGRKEKGLLRRYMALATGLSVSQVTRLLGRLQRGEELADRRRPRRSFRRKYTDEDVRLLAETDMAHGRLSGPATRKLLERAFEVFGDARYERLAGIPNGHPCNLRRAAGYRRRALQVRPTTRGSPAAIGARRRPEPGRRPGFLRVDSVHQGDRGKSKGVYFINAVDAVTQMQTVGATATLSEAGLAPVLETMLDSLRGFHSDNGSEFVNRKVAAMLERRNAEFTKSRPRRSNDNALAESKNASTLRCHFGHGHIPRAFAPAVDRFLRERFVPCLNFHRLSEVASETVDARSKVKMRFHRYSDMVTPLGTAELAAGRAVYFKLGVSFEQLGRQATASARCTQITLSPGSRHPICGADRMPPIPLPHPQSLQAHFELE